MAEEVKALGSEFTTRNVMLAESKGPDKYVEFFMQVRFWGDALHNNSVQAQFVVKYYQGGVYHKAIFYTHDTAARFYNTVK